MDIIEHYSERLRQHGDSAAAVHWADKISQCRRFSLLAEVAKDLTTQSVLDVGCGLGHLYEHLQACGFCGDYAGTDVNPSFIAQCREKFPTARFELCDIAAAPPPLSADYVFCNGVFNNARPNPQAFLHSALRHMFAVSKRALAFNAMSTYVDFMSPELAYFDPAEVFRFCKEELSPLVTLRHDYQVNPKTMPFEFAVYVYKRGLAPRRRLHATGEA